MALLLLSVLRFTEFVRIECLLCQGYTFCSCQISKRFFVQLNYQEDVINKKNSCPFFFFFFKSFESFCCIKLSSPVTIFANVFPTTMFFSYSWNDITDCSETLNFTDYPDASGNSFNLFLLSSSTSCLKCIFKQIFFCQKRVIFHEVFRVWIFKFFL